MFESLDDQMKSDNDKIHSQKERIMMYALYLAAGIVVFGGLYLGLHYLS
jgi:hypothetical protein